MAKKKAKSYNNIVHLKYPENVRRRPGMYIGNVMDGSGYNHMLMEVLDNSVDEHMAGHCNKIIVTFHDDGGSVSVSDNGRGIPLTYNKEEKMTALEMVFVKLHAGGKFDDANYEHAGGLHGVGVSVVNALSTRLRVITRREGKEATVAFSRGEKVEDVKIKDVRKASGTIVRFVPDRQIFKKVTNFNIQKIKDKLNELAHLCAGLTIELIDERNDEKIVFVGGNGLPDFIKTLSHGSLISDPVHFSNNKDKIVVESSFQWMNSSSDAEIYKYYTNNIPNPDGGTHMLGFRSALTKTVNTYISKSDLPKSLKISLSGDDVREGLVSVVTVRHPDPMFSSQTKDKLVSEDARTAVEGIVSDNLFHYLEQNPKTAKKIVTRCVNAFKAREAAKKARDAVRKSALKSGAGLLPGKLADCQSRDPDECELFIVEGSSAGGSAKQGRDRRTQAILPLRGKVLNIERAEFKKMIDNEELSNLITAIGCGIGKAFNISTIRYGKIIINTDADVDGSHIRTLLLTFLFRQMPQLIVNGNVFIAQPPLYRVNIRGKSYYLLDDKALQVFLKEKKLNRKTVKLQRFKGLGEMGAEQLWETTMNPEARQLKQIKIGNYLEADRVFGILMGNQVEPRRNYILDNSNLAKNIDV